MSEHKRKKIEEQLRMIERHLANADEYLAKGVNVEGSKWLHLDDWRGKSGHPLWMKNVMIPGTVRHRVKKERALEVIDRKAKDRGLAKRNSYSTRQVFELLEELTEDPAVRDYLQKKIETIEALDRRGSP